MKIDTVQLITSDTYLSDSILKEYSGILKDHQYIRHKIGNKSVFTFLHLSLDHLRNSKHLFQEDPEEKITILYIRLR